MLAVVRERLA